jgi:hypothetical protein
MIQPITDRNTLLGILAVRHNFLTAASLATARSEWERDPARSLGQVLVAGGLLHEKVLVALETLVEIQLNGENSASSSTPSADPLQTRLPVGDEEAGAAPGIGRSRYRVLRPHARGGLGEVFVALDEELQREVALKEIQ